MNEELIQAYHASLAQAAVALERAQGARVARLGKVEQLDIHFEALKTAQALIGEARTNVELIAEELRTDQAEAEAITVRAHKRVRKNRSRNIGEAERGSAGEIESDVPSGIIATGPDARQIETADELPPFGK